MILLLNNYFNFNNKLWSVILCDFRMLVVEFFLETNGMQNVDQTFQLPDHIKSWSSWSKLNCFFSRCSADYWCNLCAIPKDDIRMEFQTGGRSYVTSVPPTMAGMMCSVKVDSVSLNMKVPGHDESLPVVTDNLFQYNISFLRLMMDFKVLDECIHNGDINMLTVITKRLIPLFAGLHSFRSKYMIECINFITKTEYVLSQRDSVCVKLRAFVNPTGRPGHNKPADLQQENNIKAVKNVVKGLGAGQTDKALIRASEAAPTITQTTENFRSSLGLSPSKPCLTLEIPRGSIWPPSVFSNFLRNPPEFFGKKLGNPRGFNLWSFDGGSMLGVNPSTLPKVMGEIQKALSKIFIDFAIKTY